MDEIDASKQLVVEGRSAKEFFIALLRNMGLSGIQVRDFGSINNLRPYLKAFRLMPGFVQDVTSIGIVRDAEVDPVAAFRSVCDALSAASLTAPFQPSVPKGSNPQVAVLILPDPTRAGMLETLCLDAVANEPAMQCVDEYFRCMQQRHGLLPRNIFKARLHAFLASQPEPGLLLGQAAHRGYFPWNSSVFGHVKQFLLSL
jgi:hypothetical protein